MEPSHYLERLYHRLEPFYDLEKNVEKEGYPCDLYAAFYAHTDRYVASKKIVIYSIEKNQHIFIKFLPDIGEQDVKRMIEHLNLVAHRWVHPHDSHMSTFVRGIIITNGHIEPAAITQAKRYKFEKSYRFGIYGWVYNGINLVDLNDPENHIHNRRGKEDKELYTPH